MGFWKKVKKAAKKIGKNVEKGIKDAGKLVSNAAKGFGNLIASGFSFVYQIPLIGRLFKLLDSLQLDFFRRILYLGPEIVIYLASLFGLDIRKRLPICIVILKDKTGNPVCSELGLNTTIDGAKKILREEANVRLSVKGIETVSNPSPSAALNATCATNGKTTLGMFAKDLSAAGSYYEKIQREYCYQGGFQRLIGYDSPVTVVVTQSVNNSSRKGCATPVFDYAIIAPNKAGGFSDRLLAHELGHACGLFHYEARNNLMRTDEAGYLLNDWQRILLRSSRHTSYII